MCLASLGATQRATFDIAIGVRDGANLFTYLTVRRGPKGDIYVNWPRDDPNWKPHASFHASGQHHQKSHNKKLALAYCEKPDASFRGTRMVAGTPISADEPRAINRPCDLAAFEGALEIPHSELRREKYRNMITVEIVEPDHVANIVSNGRMETG